MTQGPFKNGLLQRFDSETLRRLDLKLVDLPVDREIEFPGNRIEHLFFIEEGMASMTTTFGDGSQVEVGLAGWESIQGASVLMGTKKSLNRVYMQVAGHGYSTTTCLAATEFKRCSLFHDLTLRYLQAQFIQSAQTAGCNARHSVQQRLARWLLLCADRNGGRLLPLSHEYMADMLGVNRSTVTVIARQFKNLNLIRYTRGDIKLVDLLGLEKMACECYQIVRDHLTDPTKYDQGIGYKGQITERDLQASSQ
jgi:CRP-like cAMP-binding protein